MEQPTLQLSATWFGPKTCRHSEDLCKSLPKLEDRLDAGSGPDAAATFPSQRPPLPRPDNRAILRFCYVPRRWEMALALLGILVSLGRSLHGMPSSWGYDHSHAAVCGLRFGLRPQ